MGMESYTRDVFDWREAIEIILFVLLIVLMVVGYIRGDFL